MRFLLLLACLVSQPALAQDAFVPGALGVGRTPSEVAFHVSRSRKQPSGNDKAAQIDIYAEGGIGGVWTGLVVNARSGPLWGSTGGQLFGIASEAASYSPGTGEIFGANFQAKCMVGSTPDGCEATGTEVDVITEVRPRTRIGLHIGAAPSQWNPRLQGQRASGLDVMLSFSNKVGAAPWKDGIRFFNVDGTQYPVAEDGTLFSSTPETPTRMRAGIDLSDWNNVFERGPLVLQGFEVRGTGDVVFYSGDGWVYLRVMKHQGKTCLFAQFATGDPKPVVCED